MNQEKAGDLVIENSNVMSIREEKLLSVRRAET
jgi:hypothetical protein